MMVSPGWFSAFSDLLSSRYLPHVSVCGSASLVRERRSGDLGCAWVGQRSCGLNGLPSYKALFFFKKKTNIFFTSIHHENEHFGVLCAELTEASVMTSSLRISQPPAQWKLEEPKSQAWLRPTLLASGSHVRAQCLLSPLPCPCVSWQNFV